MNTTTPISMEIKLRELAQLFNSMDPSPFMDRDLDSDAEEYIVGWSQEIPSNRELELKIHLETPPHNGRTAADVQGAVQHYFASRAVTKRREFDLLMRRARRILVVGLAFLAACLVVGQLLSRLLEGAVGEVAREGLTIAGWVALWRPLQIYLYDWWPVREDLKNLQRLSRMAVITEVEVPPLGPLGQGRSRAG